MWNVLRSATVRRGNFPYARSTSNNVQRHAQRERTAQEVSALNEKRVSGDGTL